MKLTAAFLLLCCLSVSAGGYSQTKVTLKFENADIQKVITAIEKKTNYRFLYSQQIIRAIDKVTIDVVEEDVLNVVSRILKGSKVSYELLNGYLLVFKPGDTKINEIRVTGKITGGDGQPLEGASISIKGTTIGTTTDASGSFAISVPDNAVLVVSYVGYEETEVAAKDRSVVNLQLTPTLKSSEQVVVVGYGTQKKSAITGAIAQVSLDKVTSRSFNNPAEVLQGKTPGVWIQNNGGDPTVAPSVNIRGLGGINGEQPLWVLDGVAYYSGAPLVNPSDIESVSVLKDAAAAIYGARASGGVIIVTTKKGKKGSRSQVDLDVKFGTQSARKILHSLNAADYAATMNLAAINAGRPNKPAFDAAIYPDGQITRADWMDEIFRTGKIQDYNVSISGGNENSSHYLSFAYRDNDAILLNTKTKRFIMRLNTDYNIRPWLKLGENLSYTVTNGNGANTTSAYDGALFMAIAYPSNVAPYTSTGAFSGVPDQYAGDYGDVINPVAYLKRIDYSNPIHTIYFNPYVDITIAKGLTFRSNFSYTRNNNFEKNFRPRILETGKKFFDNELRYHAGNGTEMLAEQILNYSKSFFNVHNLKATLVYAYQEREDNSVDVYGKNIPDERDELRYLDNVADYFKPGSGKSRESLLSYVARINYDYKQKYLLTASIRRDGSSKIPTKNRWQYYPSVSAGWRVSEEGFFKNITVINELKLRASWGKLGNLGSLGNSVFNVPLYSTSGYLGQNPQQVFGSAEYDISNPNIKWAHSDQTNFGIDASFLKRRLTLTADYYIKRVADMLLKRSLPSTAGVPGGIWLNTGEAEDKGIELSLGYNSAPGRSLNYSVNAVFSKNTNNLVSLAPDLKGANSGPDVRATLNPGRLQVGQPLFAYYVVQSAGIFKSQQEIDSYSKSGTKIQPNAVPGDMKFIDANNDGKISNDDRIFVGSANPDFTYGLSYNMNYKGFDLNLFLQGVHGSKLFNAVKYLGLSASVQQGFNLLEDVKNAWSPQNPNSDIPRISQTDPNGNFSTTSDWYIESGSYMRVKNITLGYTLPGTLVKRAGLNTIRVYLTANNLLTFTKYTGHDPEVGLNQYGIDNGQYPQARQVFIGLNVNF